MLIGGGDLPVPKVDPKNPDVVYSASIVTVRSTDGGKTWTSLRGAPGGDDYQNVWISPSDSNTILLGSDQGAIVSSTAKTWTSWYNQRPRALSRRHHSDVSVSGLQRAAGSGSVCIATRGDNREITFRDWVPVGTIEYGYVTPIHSIPTSSTAADARGHAIPLEHRPGAERLSDPLRGTHRVDRTSR